MHSPAKPSIVAVDWPHSQRDVQQGGLEPGLLLASQHKKKVPLNKSVLGDNETWEINGINRCENPFEKASPFSIADNFDTPYGYSKAEPFPPNSHTSQPPVSIQSPVSQGPSLKIQVRVIWKFTCTCTCICTCTHDKTSNLTQLLRISLHRRNPQHNGFLSTQEKCPPVWSLPMTPQGQFYWHGYVIQHYSSRAPLPSLLTSTRDQIKTFPAVLNKVKSIEDLTDGLIFSDMLGTF